MNTEEYTAIKNDIENGVYHQFDCMRFIIETIENKDFKLALRYGNLLIDNGQRYIGEILANQLFGEGCPFGQDELWMRNMSTACINNELIQLMDEDLEHYENKCGLWVTGHQLAEDFVEHMQIHRKITVSPEDVVHTFLKKKGHLLEATDEDTRDTLPITTVLNFKSNDIAA